MAAVIFLTSSQATMGARSMAPGAGTSVRYFSRQNLAGFTRRTCNPGCVNAAAPLTGRGPAQFYTPLEINANDPTRLLLSTQGGLSESTDQGATAAGINFQRWGDVGARCARDP